MTIDTADGDERPAAGGSGGSAQRATDLMDLSYQGLADLPPDLVSRFGRVVELSLASNSLTALPCDFGRAVFPALERLDLQRNSLCALPSSLCSLPRLRDLWLHGCRLAALQWGAWYIVTCAFFGS